MLKDVGAHFPQKSVFRLKMGVKGTPSHIGFVNNFLNGNMLKALFGQKPPKSGKNGVSRFFLPSIHDFTGQKSKNVP